MHVPWKERLTSTYWDWESTWKSYSEILNVDHLKEHSQRKRGEPCLDHREDTCSDTGSPPITGSVSQGLNFLSVWGSRCAFHSPSIDILTPSFHHCPGFLIFFLLTNCISMILVQKVGWTPESIVIASSGRADTCRMMWNTGNNGERDFHIYLLKNSISILNLIMWMSGCINDVPSLMEYASVFLAGFLRSQGDKSGPEHFFLIIVNLIYLILLVTEHSRL